MNKLLSGTAALLAAGMLASGQAAAEAKLGVSGVFKAGVALTSQDLDAGKRDHVADSWRT